MADISKFIFREDGSQQTYSVVDSTARTDIATLQTSKADKTAATQSAAGQMSAADKTKLDNISTVPSGTSIGEGTDSLIITFTT